MTKEEMLNAICTRYERKLIDLMGNDFNDYEDSVLDAAELDGLGESEMLKYVLAKYQEKLQELMGDEFSKFSDKVMDELDEKEKKDDSKRDG